MVESAFLFYDDRTVSEKDIADKGSKGHMNSACQYAL